MKWIYKGDKYKSIQINWETIDITKFPIIVYHPKWDKCYILESLGIHGNGNKLKAYIKDVYINKYYWVCAKDLELVKKCK